MTTRAALLIAGVLLGATLTSCVDTLPPPPTPSATAAASVTPTPPPSPTPTPTGVPSPATPPPPSNSVPQRVVGLTAATGGGSGEVLLTWSPNPESDIDYYIVMRSATPGGPRTRIGTMTSEDVALFPVEPFVDSNATVGYYRVRAVDTAGQQGHSSEEVCGAAPGHSC